MADESIAQTKSCTKCGTFKPFTEFAKRPKRQSRLGLCSWCRDCTRAYQRFRKSANKEKILEDGRAASKRWRQQNPEKSKASKAKWRRDNPEKHKEIVYRFRRQNPEKWAAYIKSRQTPKRRLDAAISAGIRQTLRNGSKSRQRWENLVGYTIDDLMAHLEKKFLPGMSWDNYGSWHVDHVTPKVAFNYETPLHHDFKEAWSLQNLQPLWAVENQKKHAKMNEPFQPSLAF